MHINNTSYHSLRDAPAPASPKLAIFRLQDVCVKVQRGMRGHLRTAGLEISPQIEAIFRWLRRRSIRVGLISNYDREETKTLLDRLGWRIGDAGLIDLVVLDGPKQPNAIRRAIEVAGIQNPANVVTLLDTPKLLSAAAKCEVAFNFGVTSGKYGYSTLEGQPYLALLDTPIQILNQLLQYVTNINEGGVGSDRRLA